MAVGPLPSDFLLHLGRSRIMEPRDILFLFGLSLDFLPIVDGLFLLGLKHYALSHGLFQLFVHINLFITFYFNIPAISEKP